MPIKVDDTIAVSWDHQCENNGDLYEGTVKKILPESQVCVNYDQAIQTLDQELFLLLDRAYGSGQDVKDNDKDWKPASEQRGAHSSKKKNWSVAKARKFHKYALPPKKRPYAAPNCPDMEDDIIALGPVASRGNN